MNLGMSLLLAGVVIAIISFSGMLLDIIFDDKISDRVIDMCFKLTPLMYVAFFLVIIGLLLENGSSVLISVIIGLICVVGTALLSLLSRKKDKTD